MKKTRGRGCAFFLVIIMVITATFVLSDDWYWKKLYPFHYQSMIEQEAARYNLSPYLVAAVVRVESKFRPFAESKKGARGLMQIMPETGQWAAEQMGLADFHAQKLFDPHVNIRIGTWYLAKLIEQFEGDVIVALAAYNGGQSNVQRWLAEGQWQHGINSVDDIPFPETQLFVKRVLTDERRYQDLYAST